MIKILPCLLKFVRKLLLSREIDWVLIFIGKSWMHHFHLICTHEWIKGEFFVHTKALNIHGYRLFSHVVYTLYAAMLFFHPLLSQKPCNFNLYLYIKHKTHNRLQRMRNEEQFVLLLHNFSSSYLVSWLFV